MTPKDERALALIVRYGRAIARHGYLGKWTVGSYFVAQTTIKRLLIDGFVERDPADPFRTVGPTDKGRAAAATVPPPDLSGEVALGSLPWPSGAAPGQESDDSEGSDPPDYRDADDRPIPLDEVFDG